MMPAAMTAHDAPPRLGLADLGATLLASGFGAGYSPIAPGTAGSLVGLLLFWPLAGLPFAWLAGLTAALFVLGVAAGSRVARRVGLEDPGLVVVDEIVGMWISLFFVPFTPANVVAAFLLFRGMDIAKPYPAADLEHLPGGWGIMADDVMAGVYANLVLQVGLRVVGLS
jgi:phosphatidylglycerophosphatase A